MDISIATFFAVGLGYGILHAFDPDHVAAMSGMTVGDKPRKWKTALHWSLGHGGVILFFSILVFFLGVMVPHTLSHWAESAVGLMLIAIGLHGFIKIYRTKVKNQENINRSDTGATFVGMLHGTAGSAPLLTLIPLSKVNEPIIGFIYVVLFCVGVAIAMTGLGGVLGHFVKKLESIRSEWRQNFHFILSLFAFGLGVYLLFVN